MNAVLDVQPPELPTAPPLGEIVVLAGALVVAADLLLWEAGPGVGWALAGLLGVAAVGWRSRGRMPAGERLGWSMLILTTAVQTAVEPGFSNGVTWFMLACAWLGRSWFRDAGTWWGSVAEAAWTLVRAPLRWPVLAWLAVGRAGHLGRPAGAVLRLGLIALPGLVLGGVFLLLLSGGNAVLAHGLGRVLDGLWDWLASWEWSFTRIVFWAAVATLALAWVWPFASPGRRRWWDIEAPAPEQAALAVMRPASVVGLVVVNAVFALANGVDGLFLWCGGSLPAGVNPSAYLHQGVGFLIVAVVFAAVVLVAVQQQGRDVGSSRAVRGVALAWIVQNLFVLAGVAWRLKLYVEAFQWSTLRVYVGCFVILVAAGFVLLAGYVLGQRSFGWLFRRNLAAVFVLFFTLQGVDVAGWVAWRNVEQALAVPPRRLDVDYLEALGPTAWPQLWRAAAASEDAPVRQQAAARQWLRDVEGDWRLWQARKHDRARWLAAQEIPE